ncbi:nuclease-related domain-containing protein [Sphingopyxis sp. H115]|uniref:nuclease-related domain-containing protein n=1 Tax=Sphingopyxis sp. H115 TaxID=1759073 RepID=UPI000B19F781|nr:nuclease-related domain-containing protein [Sphingopyxis sp. H115]
MTKDRSPIDRLKAFEEEADAAITALPLLQLPARAVLAGLHYLIFTSFHARQLGRDGNPEIGEVIMQRLGHVLPLIRNLVPEPYGASADDAIGAFTERFHDGSDLTELLAYMHFSEIMPEVHRGYYTVEMPAADVFRLSHRDAAFGDGQAKDITLSELAVPFPTERDGVIGPEIARFIFKLPEIDFQIIAQYVAVNAYKYRHGLAESDLVTDTSIGHIFGFDRQRFLFIRSAVLAYAEFCEKVATAMHMLVIKGELPEDAMPEALEWASVNMKEDFLIGLFAAGAMVQPDEVERFLEYYSIDFRQVPATDWGGDGFFPPFARFKDSLLFSPLMVMGFLQVRNAVYAFAKKDKKTFDNDVSDELEPVLLHHAGELLRRGGDWIVVEDVKFPGGQIDLVVASPNDDGVLLLQAKGNLAPQGARLTDRLADRVREGVGQIKKFEALADDVQRAVIEKAIGRKIGKLEAHHAVLVRSCFGAVEVFAPDFPYIRLTIPLLALALEHHRNAGLPTTIAALAQAIAATEQRIYDQSGYHWEEGEISLAGANIKLPLLKWTPGSLDALRREWWESTFRPEREDEPE